MNGLMTTGQTMSSREIAELTGKRHDNILRDIEKMLNELEIAHLKFEGSYIDTTGRALKCYNLPKRESLILVSGYNIKMRAAIIDRWQELEQQTAQGTLPVEPTPTISTANYLEAAKIMKAAKDALKGFIKDNNQLALSCSQVGFKATGVDLIKLSGVELIAHEQKQLLTVTEIGRELNRKLNAQELNKLLAEYGYQQKAQDVKGRNYWAITAKGEPWGVYQDTGKRHSDGAPVRQFKWYSSIIDEINKLEAKAS
ncbi:MULTISPECIES: Rha family transcriptional regulator [Cysteiniphilum]|uniref:Rha family transcriptional regulator n=3 Tax=Fastidiosibacteraceae TaxID=2056687 RepID=UPI0017847F1A|nr:MULTISPECIES: Rha family transcriptional regulator [Cysteiniphilum]